MLCPSLRLMLRHTFILIVVTPINNTTRMLQLTLCRVVNVVAAVQPLAMKRMTAAIITITILAVVLFQIPNRRVNITNNNSNNILVVIIAVSAAAARRRHRHLHHHHHQLTLRTLAAVVAILSIMDQVWGTQQLRQLQEQPQPRHRRQLRTIITHIPINIRTHIIVTAIVIVTVMKINAVNMSIVNANVNAVVRQ